MRVLVCGSRTFEDQDIVRNTLNGYLLFDRELTIIDGHARGVDQMAHWFAQGSSARSECYPADWKKNGKAAGPIRNQKMLDKGKPDIVLAFVDKPLQESVGTYDMVKRARRANVPTYLIWRM